MNTNIAEGQDLAIGILNRMEEIPSDVKIIIAPPFTHLESISAIIAESDIAIAAQNCSDKESGAFTGEVSCSMLESLFCDYVILGHSERREYFGENSESIAAKIKLALKHQIEPIFCIGESLQDREEGKQNEVIAKQLDEVLTQLNEEEASCIVVAYEPVWAIGTGLTASKEQAQEMHSFIRKHIEGIFGASTAESTPILYGGSCKPSNAAELFSCPDIDGGLIGGASLTVEDFIAIAKCNI